MHAECRYGAVQQDGCRYAYCMTLQIRYIVQYNTIRRVIKKRRCTILWIRYTPDVIVSIAKTFSTSSASWASWLCKSCRLGSTFSTAGDRQRGAVAALIPPCTDRPTRIAETLRGIDCAGLAD